MSRLLVLWGVLPCGVRVRPLDMARRAARGRSGYADPARSVVSHSAEPLPYALGQCSRAPRSFRLAPFPLHFPPTRRKAKMLLAAGLLPSR